MGKGLRNLQLTLQGFCMLDFNVQPCIVFLTHNWDSCLFLDLVIFQKSRGCLGIFLSARRLTVSKERQESMLQACVSLITCAIQHGTVVKTILETEVFGCFVAVLSWVNLHFSRPSFGLRWTLLCVCFNHLPLTFILTDTGWDGYQDSSGWQASFSCSARLPQSPTEMCKYNNLLQLIDTKYKGLEHPYCLDGKRYSKNQTIITLQFPFAFKTWPAGGWGDGSVRGRPECEPRTTWETR